MAVIITSDAIIVDGENLTFNELHDRVSSQDSARMARNSNNVTIYGNVVLQNNTTLRGVNNYIIVTGNLFQVKKGSTLMLGELQDNGQTKNGSTLIMDNVNPNYGFGSVVTDDSGNLLCYSSTINAYSFWSFFEGTNRVEILNSNIDGYGLVSGPDSYVKNTRITRAHGRHGTLLYKGSIREYSNVTLLTVTPEGDDGTKYSNLINISNNTENQTLEIFYGNYSGYDNLISTLDSSYDTDIVMYGTKVNNGYGIIRSDENRNNFYHKFKFKPTVYDNTGRVLSNVSIKIINKYNEVEFEGVTNNKGSIDTWITYYRDLAGPELGEVLTPHTVEITNNNETVSISFMVEDNMENFPIVLFSSSESSSIDYDLITNIVKTSDQNKADRILEELAIANTNLRQVMLGLGDSIREVPTIIRTGNQKVTI